MPGSMTFASSATPNGQTHDTRAMTDAESVAKEYPLPRRTVRLPGLIFFVALHVVGIVGTPAYIYYYGIGVSELVLFVTCCILTGMAITMGYHRLFAHRTYDTSPVVCFVLLLLGAATFQESALKWSSQHRQHHLFTDTEHDPYGVNRGFWHAHIGWILFWRHRVNYNNVKDLKKSRLVSHQHEHYAWWSIGGGIVLPMLIAWWIGHPLGGFIMAICLRLIIVLHSTFCVNSVAHTFGRKIYDHMGSARDNWLNALLTNGEGFHSYHHRFPVDYRNGVRWYHWDPSKWGIYVMSKIGLAWNLRKISDQRIAEAVGE